LNRQLYTSGLPILLQVGGADDWTPAVPFQQLVAAANKHGGRMEIDSYPGAYHSFDHPAMPVKSIVTRNSAFKGGKKTVHVGTNVTARAAAIIRIERFLEDHLKR